MKARLTIVFALIVVLPLVILGWLGLRVARNERFVIEQRFNTIALERLRDVDGNIAAFIMQREREMLSLPSPAALTVEQLRALARESATVRQFFVMNDRDELHYPISVELVREYIALKNDPDAIAVTPLQQLQEQAATDAGDASFLARLTSEEKAFLDRTYAIWTDKRIPAADTEAARSSGSGRSVATTKGWYAWYWGDGLNLIFWWRDESGVVVGAELNPVRLAADIVAMLPDTNTDNTTLPDGSILLLDTKGGAIYQWGAYVPEADATPMASLPLRVPLSAWRLTYYVPPDFTGTALGRSTVFNLASGLVVLFLAVMALSVYYFRESSREMREAKQRVSFVNQVSHELKTPLTSIRMYAEMLEEHLGEEDEKARGYMGVIVAESQRLTRLIGNVLTFSRKQRAALKIHGVAGCIDDTIGDVLEYFRPVFEARGFHITFDAGAGATAQFDRDALEQILGNLLGNIEKYAMSGGRAEIVSRQKDDVVSITVADNGPGIPVRDRDRIFAPFYRISNKHTDGVAGAGIGLAIARDLARLHGGDLMLESSETGACFKVTIQARRMGGEGVQS